MKFFIYEDGGTVDASATFGGMTLEGFLTLNQYPTDGTEAVNKEYVDGLSKELPSGGVTTGTMSTDRFPDMEGELQSAAGTGIIELSPTGVVAGNHPKVTVNKGGVVTVGEVLSSADIPGLGWEKISEVGRPTSLSGYGITNGIDLNDGVILGNIKLLSEPELGGDAVTKNYVGDKISNIVGYNVGDVITGEWGTTPEGFLQCNGGEIEKNTYPVLYSVIGDKYTNLDYSKGNGRPWVLQSGINNTTSEIGVWGNDGYLPTIMPDAVTAVTKNKVFVFGSRTNTKVYSTTINEGLIGAWVEETNLPLVTPYPMTVVTRNRIYLFGGTGKTGIFYTEIDSNGNIGNWSKDGDLPVPLSNGNAIIVKDRVYIVGCLETTSIYSCPIGALGDLGVWEEEEHKFPVNLYRGSLIATKSRLYQIGGLYGSTRNYIYVSIIQPDGRPGPWISEGTIPVAADLTQTIVTKNRAYLLGGYYHSSSSKGDRSQIQYADIDVDGVCGPWSIYTRSLNRGYYATTLITTSNRAYMLGGSYRSSDDNKTSSLIISASFEGVTDDYSPYYNGSNYLISDPSMFSLPQRNQDQVSVLKSNYYIKY